MPGTQIYFIMYIVDPTYQVPARSRREGGEGEGGAELSVPVEEGGRCVGVGV